MAQNQLTGKVLRITAMTRLDKEDPFVGRYVPEGVAHVYKPHFFNEPEAPTLYILFYSHLGLFGHWEMWAQDYSLTRVARSYKRKRKDPNDFEHLTYTSAGEERAKEHSFIVSLLAQAHTALINHMEEA